MKEYFVNVPPADNSQPFNITLAGVSYCDESYHITRENSDTLVLEYIIDGYGTVKTMGNTYYPQKGDIYLLNISENHEYFSSADQPWVKIWFNATGPLAKSLISLYSLENQTIFHSTDGEKYFHDMHNIFKSDDTISEKRKKSALLFHELIVYLAQYRNIDKSDAYKIKEIINENYYEKLTLSDISLQIYKSVSQTIRLFKNEFGITPYDYLLNTRLEQAKLFLSSSNISIKEIAYKTGFTDAQYFSNIFKQKTGNSPMEYRRRK